MRPGPPAPRKRAGCFAWGCGVAVVALVAAGVLGALWYVREVQPWLAEKKHTLDQLSAALSPDAGLLGDLAGAGGLLTGPDAPRGAAGRERFPEPGLIPSFAEAPAFDTVSADEAAAFFHASTTAAEVLAELTALGELAGYQVAERNRDAQSPARRLELSRADRQVRADVVATGLAPGVDVFLVVTPGAAPATDGGAP